MADDSKTARFTTARKAMVDSQLRTSGVNAPFVLARMGSVPREDFVPEAQAAFAYMDRAVPLSGRSALPPPVVQGRMLEEAAPALSDDVLLVDHAPSYLAELLRPLVTSVTVISPEDAVKASRKRTKHTLLIVHGAAEQLPDTLVKRLADDGRIVTGLFDRGVTRIAIGRKSDRDVAFYPVAEMGIPVLEEFAKPKAWSF
ncbi:protein-L-isoaspartate O-methyltransferase family protein [Paraurantiacibacter namhicola]|uniref:Protein-L-isoaspartate O-methyltransferase n=1 Tax=Paraurantiacibacter namhicola TaxID=645517 RepID=A0A1C7D5M7_9SPHN|nr:protein-L-isoaspartate O-methyltransferase [Paraurantiacibacter namhicola]ANU06774.1 protein-L-isoaspartate O-methyltransferase [Paraurantiacibacter namhicola]